MSASTSPDNVPCSLGDSIIKSEPIGKVAGTANRDAVSTILGNGPLPRLAGGGAARRGPGGRVTLSTVPRKPMIVVNIKKHEARSTRPWIFLAVALIAPQSLVAEDRFRLVVLSEEFHSEGAAVADLDGNGDNDIISGPNWYAGPDFRRRYAFAPVRRTAIKAYSDHFFHFVHDFDRDKRPDILSLPIPGGKATWFRNQGTREPWAAHSCIDKVGGESPTFVDLTGDGAPSSFAFATALLASLHRIRSRRGNSRR